MQFVCPVPRVWAEIHGPLQEAWERQGRHGPPPPIPLILAGWAYSDDTEKHSRWLATLDWAEQAELSHLVPALAESDLYKGTR